MVFGRILAIAAILTAMPVLATECGVNNRTLTKPFAGHWRSETGELYDIAPGKLDHTFTIHLVTGDETKHSSGHFVIENPEGEPSDSMLDCRTLTAEERDKIERDLSDLAGLNSPPESDEGRQNRKEISLFHASLAHPPYPMMALTHYEDLQWLILSGSDSLLDVWFGEGEFSVRRYERVR